MLKTNSYIPQENLALKFMREKRQLSLLFVGKKLEIKPKDIDHMEHGRRSLTQDEITKFLECYNYSIDVFTKMLKIKPLTKQAANRFFLLSTR